MKLVACRNGILVALLDCGCILLYRILVSDEVKETRRGLEMIQEGCEAWWVCARYPGHFPRKTRNMKALDDRKYPWRGWGTDHYIAI